ncbi:MAG: hypothetical protein KIT56_10395 [Gammaproteobacteria bacterium]|nr:hypothetical protein [Gammaproteobacteria bacterium]MCW5584259.1 hypothetical protein [Gammaproteobacteria bacterium]
MKFRLIESGLLKHPYQINPCYRKVISYSFFRYLKQNNITIAQAEFNRMTSCIQKNELFLLKDFLGIYPAIMSDNGNIGYFIVESSRGCFPLVIYPNSHTQQNLTANKTRKSALSAAIRKLKNNQQKIFDTLAEHDEWTLELESKLEKLFEYPNRCANDSNFSSSITKVG